MRSKSIALMFMVALVASGIFSPQLRAQCIDYTEGKTAVKFANESRYDLTFFIDDDEKGVVVPAGKISKEFAVDPGEHLLRARAIVRGESFWVWVENEFPKGQICTWTIDDPQAGVLMIWGKHTTILPDYRKGR